MVRFFRIIRQNLLTDNKVRKYLIYAIGEVILVVIGILIALQINNWNENRKESQLEDKLIEVLITDLQLKKEEFVSDLAIGRSILQKSDTTIKYWEKTGNIDTLYLRSLLNVLAQDNWFFNENSPVYATISGSGLWKQLPDSLTRQIDDIYRSSFGTIKTSFERQTEYALQSKLNFLGPNRLLSHDKSTYAIQQIVTENATDFILYLELFKSGVVRLTSKFSTTIPSIDKLIQELKLYKKNKK